MELARYWLLESREPMRTTSTLVVGISASGETARTIEAIELSKAAGARTLAISNAPESTLAELAHEALVFDLPDLSFGPGLLSYLAALLSGYALAASSAEAELGKRIDAAVARLAEELEGGERPDWQLGVELAERLDPLQPIVFLGSGPTLGSAMFSAAKVIEAAGHPAWAQEVEEWAHLEYFLSQADSPVWLFQSHGRAASREREVLDAARRLGRDLVISEALEIPGLGELLAPLSLWTGPASFADALMSRLNETPFRGFGGGRSQEEGGGANRIRSSKRVRNLSDLSQESLAN